jgi:aryl-alcohol dehydrogenase-like predicted oxidoreductase
VIATKVGYRAGASLTQSGLSRRHILLSVDRSLERLGTDWIDIYIVHLQDPLTRIEETLDALNTVVRAGKVRYLGFSNWSAWKAAAALEIQESKGLAPFTHGQMHYSLLCRDVERDIIPMMRQYGLGLTVWSPLAFGFLSGTYTPESLSDPANRYAHSAWDLIPFSKQFGFDLVEKMRAIAVRHGASVAQVAIAWLLSHPSVTSVIIGATKLYQLEDNLGAGSLNLVPTEIAELDALTAPPPVYPNWLDEKSGDDLVLQALGRKASIDA